MNPIVSQSKFVLCARRTSDNLIITKIRTKFLIEDSSSSHWLYGKWEFLSENYQKISEHPKLVQDKVNIFFSKNVSSKQTNILICADKLSDFYLNDFGHFKDALLSNEEAGAGEEVPSSLSDPGNRPPCLESTNVKSGLCISLIKLTFKPEKNNPHLFLEKFENCVENKDQNDAEKKKNLLSFVCPVTTSERVLKTMCATALDVNASFCSMKTYFLNWSSPLYFRAMFQALDVKFDARKTTLSAFFKKMIENYQTFSEKNLDQIVMDILLKTDENIATYFLTQNMVFKRTKEEILSFCKTIEQVQADSDEESNSRSDNSSVDEDSQLDEEEMVLVDSIVEQLKKESGFEKKKLIYTKGKFDLRDMEMRSSDSENSE